MGCRQFVKLLEDSSQKVLVAAAWQAGSFLSSLPDCDPALRSIVQPGLLAILKGLYQRQTASWQDLGRTTASLPKLLNVRSDNIQEDEHLQSTFLEPHR